MVRPVRPVRLVRQGAMTFAEKVSAAPDGPGVYLLKDSRGRVIYVGKARVLRDRLRTYTGQQDNARLAALVSRVRDLETVVTRSEVEALVLEENFIKFHKPRFNVRLRDDKKFPYLKLTTQDPFPRIFVTRNIPPDGSSLFGPYTNARELRKALRAVKRVFRLRTCTWALPEARPRRPCLEFDVGRCTAPCAEEVSQSEYARQVDNAVRFLSGRSDALAEEFEARMWTASQAQDFEVAAALRDQLLALREIRREQQAAMPDRVSRDIVGLARGERAAMAVVLRVREGKLVAKEEYPLTAERAVPDGEVVAGLIRSIHIHTADIPEEIIVPAEPDDRATLEDWFAQRHDRRVRIVVPERGEKVKLVQLARFNADKALVELAPDERVPRANEELAKVLGLATVPRLIEGVDISNTQGTNAVGSVVVFRDDRPSKMAYRLFRVRTVQGPNDFAMMEEVLARRVRGLLEKNKPLPDLVLVDGGKGQLSAAVRAYGRFDTEIPILGL
ncbi:MAG: excinuclease ABC subunit UvrC, partial [bacterium]